MRFKCVKFVVQKSGNVKFLTNFKSGYSQVRELNSVAPDVVGHQPQRPRSALLCLAGGRCCQEDGQELGRPRHLPGKTLD